MGGRNSWRNDSCRPVGTQIPCCDTIPLAYSQWLYHVAALRLIYSLFISAARRKRSLPGIPRMTISVASERWAAKLIDAFIMLRAGRDEM